MLLQLVVNSHGAWSTLHLCRANYRTHVLMLVEAVTHGQR